MEKKKLHHIKSTGFKTPDNYFESFDAKLKERLTEKELIKDIDTSGFKIPENYFDTLDDKILSQIEEGKPVISLKSRRTFYYIAGIAASLVLMFNVLFTSETLTINDIETASIEDYLEEEDFTSYELAALLTEDELNENNFIEYQIPESTIEDYLLDNVTIEELIIE